MIGVGFFIQGGCVGGAILIALRFFPWFFWRNDPIEATIFAQLTLDEVGTTGKEGQSGAEEIRGVLHGDFVGLAALDKFRDLIHALVSAHLSDAGIILLEQTGERHSLEIRGKTCFDDGFGFVLSRGIDLGEARTEEVGLPEIRADGLLLRTIIDHPSLGPVVAGPITDQDNFEERLVRLEVVFVVELRSERTKLLEEADTDELKVGVTSAFGAIGLLGVHGRTKISNISVEANGHGLRGDLPLGSAEKDANVRGANGSDAGRYGFGFQGMIDGAEDDAVGSDVNDHAATGEVGHDFVFLREGGKGREGECDKKRQERPHVSPQPGQGVPGPRGSILPCGGRMQPVRVLSGVE